MRTYLITILLAGLAVGALTEVEWCGKNSSFKQAASGTCKGYWECNQGYIEYKKCSVLHSFDSVKNECVWNPTSSSDVPCGNVKKTTIDDKWCSFGKTYKSPVNGVCNSYYNCKNGLMSLETCTWPLKFNPNERECKFNVWPNKFECYNTETKVTPNPTNASISNSSKVPTPMPSVKPTTATIKCFEGQHFSTVYPADCSKFYECNNGRITVRDCGLFSKYDPTTLDCKSTLLNNVNCSAPVAKPTSEPPTPTAVSTKPSNPTIRPSDIAKKIGCIKGNYFTSVYADDCQKYYLCSNGSVTIKDCGVSYRFNPVTHECEFNMPLYNNVNCSAKSEKPVCKNGYTYKTSLPNNDKKYYVCKNDKLTVHECGVLMNFYTADQDCHFGYSVFDFKSNVNKEFKCRKNSYYNVTYPGDCHKYYNCRDQLLSIRECPYLQKFDRSYGKCITMTNCDLLTCYDKGPLCYPGYDYTTTVPDHCDKYSECKEGTWSLKSCPWMHKFDPKTLHCRFSLPFHRVNCTAETKCVDKPLINFKISEDEKIIQNEIINSEYLLEITNSNLGVPKCTDDSKFKTVHPKDCSKYYVCNYGRMTLRQCSTFEKFDPKILDCRFSSPWDPVDCSSLPGEPYCERGHDFKAVIPAHCNKYYNCKNGSLTVESCHFWQKFDPMNLECRTSIPLIYSVNCSAVPGVKEKRTVKVESTNNAYLVVATAVPVKGPTCNTGLDFKSVYSGDCKKYFQCINGTETVEKCFWWRKFDPATLKCSWDLPFDRVNCSAIPGSGLPKPIVFPQVVKNKCKNGLSFNAVDKKDCDAYFSCNNGSLSYEKCGWFKSFNPKTLSCRLDAPFHRVNCSAMPGEPECPKTGVIRKPFPLDCLRYYECNNGTLSVNHCGILEKFDYKKLQCIFDLPWSNINCENSSS